MSILWLKNFAGLRQSDADFRKVSNGKIELGIHVTAKSIQAMTVFGSVLAPTFVILLRKGCPKATLFKAGKLGALSGVFIGPVATAIASREKTEEEVAERCHRLRRNEGQLWVDRSFVIAATLGFMSAGASGMVIGMNSAVLLTPMARGAWKTTVDVCQRETE